MTERRLSGRKAEEFFEDLWKRGDPWELETAAFEQARYARQLRILEGRRYPRTLEIGCGAGAFTLLLTRIADRVLAIDVSPAAITRAQRVQDLSPGRAEFRAANVMEYDPAAEGAWDLVVLSETIYYLGWLYSFFDIGWLSFQLYTATSDGGRLLLANTFGGGDDYLLRPWVIRTYRDLFVNVGYRIESEEIFRGVKSGTDIEVLISLFTKSPHRGP